MSGQTVTLTSSTGGGYLWSTGATTKSITVNTAGIYTVRVYNAGNCFATSLPTNVYLLLLKQTDALAANETNLSAFPNPVKDQLTIAFNAGKEVEYFVKLNDMLEREVYSEKIFAAEGQNKVMMNLSGYKKGIYIISLIREGEEKHLRVMVD